MGEICAVQIFANFANFEQIRQNKSLKNFSFWPLVKMNPLIFFAKIDKILELTFVISGRFKRTFLKQKCCVLSLFSLKERILRTKFQNLIVPGQIYYAD